MRQIQLDRTQCVITHVRRESFECVSCQRTRLDAGDRSPRQSRKGFRALWRMSTICAIGSRNGVPSPLHMEVGVSRKCRDAAVGAASHGLGRYLKARFPGLRAASRTAFKVRSNDTVIVVRRTPLAWLDHASQNKLTLGWTSCGGHCTAARSRRMSRSTHVMTRWTVYFQM